MKALGTISIAALALALACAACGNTPSSAPDAGAPDAPTSPDGGTTVYAACAELSAPSQTIDVLPAHLLGNVTGGGADLTAPGACAITNAPYGVQTAGDDDVIALTGLTPGVDYVVRMIADADLSFYVITGCSSASGPIGRECLVYEDASTSGAEVGHFVAPDGPAWIVIDYYATQPPSDGTWSIDVYPSQCTGDAQCGGATPSCLDGRCVGCTTSFDCHDPAQPVCDTSSHTCDTGTAGCSGDDAPPIENRDDGPAGARVLVPNGQGLGQINGHVCNAPPSERDFIAFTVTQPGDDWELQLDWQTSADLDLEIFDAAGQPVGLSFYEHPEDIVLTYLPAGTYYAAVSQFSSQQISTSTAYQLRTARFADACTGAADCAAEYRNQLYRGDCSGGACRQITGGGALGIGTACDSVSDCAAGSSCPSFFFTANADSRDVCAPFCASDGQCTAALGPGFVCTTYAPYQDFCVAKCTDDQQCPVNVNKVPSVPPWARLHCDQTDGHCK